MNYQEKELQKLRASLVKMFEYTREQMRKAKTALLTENYDLAEEVINNESRVNAFDLSINSDCVNYLALHQPVAGDLRLLIALIKCVTSTERIGDHANGIAKFLLDLNSPYSQEMITELQVEAIFDQAEDMFADVTDALENENADYARRVFRKDKFIDNKNLESPDLIANFYSQNKKKDEELINGLYLFRTIGKLERVGDLVKNIAEEIIYYLEAQVLSHSKKSKS